MSQRFMNLTLAAIPEIDGGKVSLAFQRGVEDCLRDIADRPIDKKPRKITMVFTMLPVTGEDPQDERRLVATGLTTEITVRTSIPDRITKPYSFALTETADGRGNSKPTAYFSLNSPENVQQITFADAASENDENE